MITLTYYFNNVAYILAEMPDNAADLTIQAGRPRYGARCIIRQTAAAP